MSGPSDREGESPPSMPACSRCAASTVAIHAEKAPLALSTCGPPTAYESESRMGAQTRSGVRR
eukprot:5193163-Pyramimonas_sp.AAC.1